MTNQQESKMPSKEELENEREVDEILFNYLQSFKISEKELLDLARKANIKEGYVLYHITRNEGTPVVGDISTIHQMTAGSNDDEVYFSFNSSHPVISLTNFYLEHYGETWYLVKEEN